MKSESLENRGYGGEMATTRLEHDALGDVQVPADRLWGAQTQRSLEYFAIGVDRFRFTRPVIRALGLVKKGAARANHELGRALVALGRSDGIERLRAAALNYESHFGRDDVRTAEYRFVLGEALLAVSPEEARPMLDQAARALVAAEGNVLPVRARAERWLASR